MNIQCPQCGARYRIDPRRSDKAVVRVKCPRCATVFRIALAEKDEAPPASASRRPPAAAPSDSGKKVLVVDDSKFFRELIVDVLKNLPLGFLTASGGNEALELVRRERPSLVILDLNLDSGMDGYQLIREIRADSSLQGIRLLAMSGVFRQPEDADEVQKAGADGFIPKSFRPEQLQARVAGLLEV